MWKVEKKWLVRGGPAPLRGKSREEAMREQEEILLKEVMRGGLEKSSSHFRSCAKKL